LISAWSAPIRLEINDYLTESGQETKAHHTGAGENLLAQWWCIEPRVGETNPLWHNAFRAKRLGIIPAQQEHPIYRFFSITTQLRES
jgi:hypothetical protein